MTLALAVALIVIAELMLTVGVPALDTLDRRFAAHIQLLVRGKLSLPRPQRRAFGEMLMRQQRQGQPSPSYRGRKRA